VCMFECEDSWCNLKNERQRCVCLSVKTRGVI